MNFTFKPNFIGKMLLSFVALFFLMFAANMFPIVSAQEIPDGTFEGDTPNVELINQYAYLLQGALTFVVGLIMKALGVKKAVPKFVYAVAAAGIVIIGIFLAFDTVQAIPAAITLLSTMGFADLIFGAFKKPKIE